MGPSPRVRGAERKRRHECLKSGTIPAGAGSSRTPRARSAGAWDHPRGCGEQSMVSRRTFTRRGPSPRVRGAGGVVAPPGDRSGTIPAGAGSRAPSAVSCACSWDHPRGCGEQASGEQPTRGDAGPSPRVRGAGRASRGAACGCGTIPAGAGSSAPLCQLDLEEGTIPAGAGSRRCGSVRPGPGRDHPRGCGEQTVADLGDDPVQGPSPRVRGADGEQADQDGFDGTIPAGAGSSAARPARSPPRRDHPRGCGEQIPTGIPTSTAAGPSPRVRGAVRAGRGPIRPVGTIPAGAGSRPTAAPTSR